MTTFKDIGHVASRFPAVNRGFSLTNCVLNMMTTSHGWKGYVDFVLSRRIREKSTYFLEVIYIDRYYIHTYMCVYIHTYIHTCVYIQTYMCVCVCVCSKFQEERREQVIDQQEVEERDPNEGFQSHEEEKEFTHASTKDNEDLVKEKEPEDIKHDEVLMCAPSSNEAIPNPFPPAQKEEDEVSHFPFQVFDDTLFYDSEGEEEREPLDELDPLYYEAQDVGASHEDEALMLTLPFDEVIQAFDAPAREEVNTVSCFPFQDFDDDLFCDLESK
jgi:hypothetical protein